MALSNSATVLVTGGTNGIGRATVDRLLAEGYEVVNVNFPVPRVCFRVKATCRRNWPTMRNCARHWPRPSPAAPSRAW
jgi:nucleoside-diphosphate-sugar epimerase